MCRRRCTDPLTRCLECEQEYLTWLEDQHDFDRLCQSDPRLDPGWKPATDAEYRAHRLDTTTEAHPDVGAAAVQPCLDC